MITPNTDFVISPGIQVFYLAEVKMFKKKGKKAKQFWHVNVPVTMGTIPLNPANAQLTHAPLRATLSNNVSVILIGLFR